MPPNFGILPNFTTKIRNKRERYGQYAERSLEDLEKWRLLFTQNSLAENAPKAIEKMAR
jgi:folate-dependent tRNA-U54 methylase TrmFO/GidA